MMVLMTAANLSFVKLQVNRIVSYVTLMTGKCPHSSTGTSTVCYQLEPLYFWLLSMIYIARRGIQGRLMQHNKMEQALVRSDSGFQSLEQNYLSSENNQLMTYSKTQKGTELPDFDVLLLRDPQIKTLDNDIQQMKQSQFETQKDIRKINEQLNQIIRGNNGMQKMFNIFLETYFMNNYSTKYESKSGKIPVEAETPCKTTAEVEDNSDEICSKQDNVDELNLHSSHVVECPSLQGSSCYSKETEVKPFKLLRSKLEKKEGSQEMSVTAFSPKVQDNDEYNVTENQNIVRYEDLYHLKPCLRYEPTGPADSEQEAVSSPNGCSSLDFVDIKSEVDLSRFQRKSGGKVNTDTPKRKALDSIASNISVRNRKLMNNTYDQVKCGSSELNKNGSLNSVDNKRRYKVEAVDTKTKDIKLEKEIIFMKNAKGHHELYKYRKKKILNDKKTNIKEMHYRQKQNKNIRAATKFKQKPFLSDDNYVRRQTRLENSKVTPTTLQYKHEYGRYPVKHLRGHGTKKKRRHRYWNSHANIPKKPYGNGNNQEKCLGNGSVATNVCFSYSTKEILLLVFLILAIVNVAFASDKSKKSEENHCSRHCEDELLIVINIAVKWFLIVSDTVFACFSVNIQDITVGLYNVYKDCSLFTIFTFLVNVGVFWIIKHLKSSHCDVTILRRREIIERCFYPNEMRIKMLIKEIERKEHVDGNFYLKTEHVPVLFQDWSMTMIALKENNRSFIVEILDTDG